MNQDVVKSNDPTMTCGGCGDSYESKYSLSVRGVFSKHDLALKCGILAAWQMGMCCLATLIILVCKRQEHVLPAGGTLSEILWRSWGRLTLSRLEITWPHMRETDHGPHGGYSEAQVATGFTSFTNILTCIHELSE